MSASMQMERVFGAEIQVWWASPFKPSYQPGLYLWTRPINGTVGTQRRILPLPRLRR